MSNSKHTPGPWIGANEHGKYNRDHTWSVDDDDAQSCVSAPLWADGKVIALVVHSRNTFSVETHPSIDANARLIAAAPDLLEALQGLIALCHEAGFPCDKAEEVVNKATGETK
jgi:hypothetical protein